MWTHSRHALQTLARCEVPAHLRAKLDPDDLVQSALIQVQQADASFDGRSEPEVVESLRQALISALAERSSAATIAGNGGWRTKGLPTG